MSEPSAPIPPPEDAALGRSRFVVKYGKFLVVGLTGFVVNLIVFTLVLDAISPGPSSGFFESITHFLTETSSDPSDALIASAVAFAVATLWNFTLNNAWTFRTRLRHRHSLGYRLALYFGVSLGSLAINEIVLVLSSTTLPPLYGQGIGIIAGSLVGFVGNARFTFAEAEEVEPN
ncbi:MAG: GtrA family protein [Thermoplasmata archaeon]